MRLGGKQKQIDAFIDKWIGLFNFHRSFLTLG